MNAVVLLVLTLSGDGYWLSGQTAVVGAAWAPLFFLALLGMFWASFPTAQPAALRPLLEAMTAGIAEHTRGK